MRLLVKSYRQLRETLRNQANGYCLLCRQPTQAPRLCYDCQKYLCSRENRCQLCATPLAGEQTICGHCQLKPPPWQRLVVAAHYRGSIIEMVQRLKFKHQSLYAPVLADLLLNSLRGAEPLPELLLPVPLHWRRRLKRGYNQAELIARHLGRALDIPLDTKSLVRHRSTRPQSDLDRQQRRKNLKGAFHFTQVEAQHIALVDDVITTGSTLREICRLLGGHKIKTIQLWVPCYTPPKKLR
ncbi:ComF family protein [Dongshaea marina]|uniref:ComF family protein n=1 Tax=Dongshaea marina TaxID=2047966 RepID=UPI00131ED789|nr:phosphoribosyltransferase family protein [Dongshaea marina]